MEEWQSEAQKEKEKGNQLFKSGDYNGAAECYTNAITFDDTNSILYSNRAQCFLNLGRYYECEKDCNDALARDGKLVKCYFRRGQAKKLLHRYEEAERDFSTVLKMDPSNKQAQIELAQIRRLLEAGNIKINPVVKPFKFQSKEPLREVKISELRTAGSNSAVIKMPESIPSTSFEFYRDWRLLRKDNSSEKRLDYLKLVGSQRLWKLFEHSLEPNVFEDILHCLKECEDKKFVLDVLQELSKISRFSSLLLFLEASEKQILQDLFQLIYESEQIDSHNVATLAKKYDIPLTK